VTGCISMPRCLLVLAAALAIFTSGCSLVRPASSSPKPPGDTQSPAPLTSGTNGSSPPPPPESPVPPKGWTFDDVQTNRGPDDFAYAAPESDRTYGIFLRTHGQERKITEIGVPSVRSYRLRVLLSPDHQYVACLTDWDGRSGSGLTVYKADGSTVLTRTGYVVSMLWTPDSKRLAIVVLQGVNQKEAKPPLVSLLGLGGQETFLPTDRYVMRLVTFGENTKSLYAVTSRTPEPSPGSLTRFDIASGAVTDILTGSSSSGWYSGYRVVPQIIGENLVTFSESKSPKDLDGCCRQLVLARLDGTRLRVLPPNDLQYMEVVWSRDLTRVAYKNSAGIWVADGEGKRPEKLVSGFLWDWTVEQVTAEGAVWVRHDLGGFYELRTGTPFAIPEIPQ